MAAVESLTKEAQTIALPGLGRALVIAGKLGQKAVLSTVKSFTKKSRKFVAENMLGNA